MNPTGGNAAGANVGRASCSPRSRFSASDHHPPAAPAAGGQDARPTGGAIATGARPSGRFSVRPTGRSVNAFPLPEGGRNLAGGKVPAPPTSCTPAGCWNAAHHTGVPRPLRGRRFMRAFPGVSSPPLLNPRLSSIIPPGWSCLSLAIYLPASLSSLRPFAAHLRSSCSAVSHQRSGEHLS